MGKNSGKNLCIGFSSIPSIDGYSLSQSYQGSDNMDKALTQWKKQIEEYPLGDMIAETSQRLTWVSTDWINRSDRDCRKC